MALTVEKTVREFKYNGMALADPGAQMSPEEVKTFYAAIHPELTNAAVEGPEHKGNRTIYEFRRAVGTKGADTPTPVEQWAIVELFGHQRIAGRISEQTLGGCSFVRIDVPEIPAQPPTNQYNQGSPAIPAYSKLLGNGAIYGMTFVDEPIARAAAAEMRSRPVDSYTLQGAILAAGRDSVQRLLAQPEDGLGD